MAETLEQDPFFQGWEWHRWPVPGPVSSEFIPRLILVEASLDPDLSFLRLMQEQFPSSIRILLQDVPGLPILRTAVNRAEVFSVLPWPEHQDQLPDLLREAVMEAELLESRIRLLRESTRQNRELEKLNEGLETLVEERTQHIQLSKEAEDEKVSRIRGLIRFIQELSTTSSLEDLLDLLRRDLRSFHQVNDPVLIYEIDSRGPQVAFWRQSSIHIRPWPHQMAFVPHIHLQDPEMSKRLANEFQRPFGKAMVLPLEVPGSDLFPQPVFHLVLENSLPENEISPVLDFCLERLQPLCTAVERIRLETELTHFSFRWEKTFDGLKDPIAIIDRADRVLRANKKFSDRVVKGVCYENFATRNERCEGCPVPEALATGQAKHGQVRRDGRVFEVYSYPISLVPGGRPTNVVNQYVDQTHAREIYMRLLQSEKMGALGLLAGNIAHELNNPLSGLRSLAQVLRSEVPEQDQVGQDLGEIEKAAERCQKIIRNLLDFVQQEEHDLQDVSMDELVEKTLPFLKTAMRMLRLQKDFQTQHLLIRVEPHLLQQVIFNLIHNACQAMGATGTLLLQTRVENTSVRLWIHDTGPGVSEVLLEKIFEPFFTTKKEGSGTGLGLSLSKEIVESFGGRIGIESRTLTVVDERTSETIRSLGLPGSGASFWIEFPLAGVRS